MAMWKHLFPSRTQQLSTLAPTIVIRSENRTLPGKTFKYYGGLAQLGEHLPYKQGVGGSIPSSSTIIMAEIAQLVEQLTCNQ